MRARVIREMGRAVEGISCYEAGYDGFWLHRQLEAQGIRNYVIDPASLQEVVGRQVAERRVVVAHLGNGASMCAMHQRGSVATTMGFTALDGLPMGQRCGNLDPGVVLYLQIS